MSIFTEQLKEKILEAISDYLSDLPFQAISDCDLYLENDDDSLRLHLDPKKIQGNTYDFSEE